MRETLELYEELLGGFFCSRVHCSGHDFRACTGLEEMLLLETMTDNKVMED